MKQPILLLCVILFPLMLSAQNKTGQVYKKKSRESVIQYSHDGKHTIVNKKNSLLFRPSGSDYIDKKIMADFHIDGMAVSNSNTFIAVYGAGSLSNKISVYNQESAALLYTHKCKGGKLLDVKFLNDSTLVSISADYTVRLIDVSSGTITWQHIFKNNILRALAIQPYDAIISVAGSDGSVYLIHTQNNYQLTLMKGSSNWMRTLDFSPDGKILLAGSDDGRIYLYDIAQPDKAPNSYSAHENWVRFAKFTADNNYILSVGDDQQCTMYDVVSKKVSFQIKKVGAPVTALALNPTGQDFIINSVFPKNAYVRDLSTYKIIPYQRYKNNKDKLAPQIYISNLSRSENEKTIVYTELYKLEGTVIDESGLREVKVNGKVVKIKDNGNFVMYIPLALGDNPINLEAIDVNDNTSVKRLTIIRKNSEGELIDAAAKRNYLIVIGINDYKKWPQLNNAVKDAQNVYSVLTEKYDFDTAYSKLIIDSMATKDNIEKTIRGLISTVTPNDNLLIYYAGHGYFDPLLNEGYWIPVEAVNESQYISNTLLLKYIANINSKHTFLVVDACFSGSLFSSTTRGYTENVEKFKSRWCLASGRLETVADGAYGTNSPFANNFINYLQNNSRKEFPSSELVQYVKINVANTTKQTPIGNALSNVGDEGGEFVFKLK